MSERSQRTPCGVSAWSQHKPTSAARRSSRRVLVMASVATAAGVSSLLITKPARAGNLFWDATPDAGTTLDYGSGTWSTSDANWWNGTNYVSWTPASFADVANIGSLSAQGGKSYTGGATAPAFTLTLGSDISLNQITQSGNVNSGNSVTIGNAAGNNFALTIGGSGAGFGNNAGATPLIIDVVVHGTGGLSKFNGGVVWLKQSNDYTGGTSVSAGTLRAVDGVGLPTNSALNITTTAVFETSGNFTRALGTANGQVRVTTGTNSGGGFSAFGGSAVIAIGGLASPTALNWGSTNFSPTTSLVLNAVNADSELLFQNDMNLTSTGTVVTRTFTANATATAVATVGGVLSSTADVAFVKNGNGTLALAAVNTFTGSATVSAGTLRLVGGDNRLNPAVNLTVSGGVLDLGGNTQSNSATVVFAGGTTQNGTLTAANAFDGRAGTVSATLVGGNGLNKTTSGLLNLTGQNLYTGVTTISGGTVRAVDGIGLPTNSALVIAGGVLETRGTFARSLGTAPGNVQVLAGAGGFSANGGTVRVAIGDAVNPPALTWGDANFNPTTLILNGAAADSAMTFANAIDLNNGSVAATRTINVNSTNAATLAGPLTTSGSGAVGLTKTGSGTLILPVANSFSGTTFVNAGMLAIGNNQVFGSSLLNFGNSTIVSTDATPRTVTNAVSYSANETFGSPTTGDLQFTGTVALGSLAKTATVNNAVTTFSGLMSGGTNALTKAGPGTLVLSNAASNFARPVVITGGTLAVTKLANGGAVSAIGNASSNAANIVIDGGSLQYLGAGDDINRLFTIGTNGATIDASGAGAIGFTNAGAVAFAGTTAVTLVLTGTNTGNNRLASTVADAAANSPTSLTKNGVGTWTLGGVNTYSGSTTVNAGRLAIAAANAIASTSAMTLNGGTFDTGGLSDTVGALTLAASSAVDFGTGTSFLSFADSRAMAWTGTLLISNWSGTPDTGGGTDRLFFGNALGTLTTAQLGEIQFEGFNPGATQLATGEVVPVSTPEPTTLGLLALGTAGLLRRRRRRVAQ